MKNRIGEMQREMMREHKGWVIKQSGTVVQYKGNILDEE